MYIVRSICMTVERKYYLQKCLSQANMAITPDNNHFQHHYLTDITSGKRKSSYIVIMKCMYCFVSISQQRSVVPLMFYIEDRPQIGTHYWGVLDDCIFLYRSLYNTVYMKIQMLFISHSFLISIKHVLFYISASM